MLGETFTPEANALLQRSPWSLVRPTDVEQITVRTIIGIRHTRRDIAMKLPGNLPVKTRIPFKLWVFAGVITVSSLMHVATQSQLAFHSQLASGPHLIAALR